MISNHSNQKVNSLKSRKITIKSKRMIKCNDIAEPFIHVTWTFCVVSVLIQNNEDFVSFSCTEMKNNWNSYERMNSRSRHSHEKENNEPNKRMKIPKNLSNRGIHKYFYVNSVNGIPVASYPSVMGYKCQYSRDVHRRHVQLSSVHIHLFQIIHKDDIKHNKYNVFPETIIWLLIKWYLSNIINNLN